MKMKSLEDRLTFITKEKDKQMKEFQEKLDHILKEHESEMQRLKEIHKYCQKNTIFFFYLYLQ